MAERPLLGLPPPTRSTPKGKPKPVPENVTPASPARQAARVGPKFDRLSQVLPDPQQLADLRNDPSSIAPERALVFEIASSVVDFDRARRNVPGLEFLGEEEDEIPADDDFGIEGRADKGVPRRIYFTMPDAAALREIVRLWRLYQEGRDLGYGRTEWRKVFAHLSDIRPWGPKDRLTEDVQAVWHERLRDHPDEPIRFEVELWYRPAAPIRESAHRRLEQAIARADGRILDQATIPEIRYDAALVEVMPAFVQSILDNPDVGLAAFDEVMVLRPQSLVTDPHDADFDLIAEAEADGTPDELGLPVAALLDGMPMAQHDNLAGRLSVDDPDDFSALYGQASDQRHGTSMASIIIHGDLNNVADGSGVNRSLYVRPVMYPQPTFDGNRECMPPDKLAIDLIWRAFIRMFSGEGGAEPTAPTVRIVNISLGDVKRRFAGVLSPWARLIDYLSWEHGVLILVSAGNIPDPIPLDGVAKWSDYEDADPAERETILLRAILRKRADRRLLAPSEGLNGLTIGACHMDGITPNGSSPLAVDPYANPFLPNPSSALGLGYLRGVKPEILLPGGREHVRANSSVAPIEVRPVATPGAYFGIGAAAPGLAGETNRKLNFSGTSVATALATHSALKILAALEDIPAAPPLPIIDSAFHSVILKALLVHAARWDGEIAAKIQEISKENGAGNWQHQRDDAARFLGFVIVDIERVVECSESRATLIGWNTISANESDEFRVPLPPEIENLPGFRAVTATVAWLTPLNTVHRMYRMAKFEIQPGGDEGLSLGVKNAKEQPSHNAFGRGTVYQRRWEGEKARAFVDGGDLVLSVTCKPAAGELDVAIPYGIVITFEVGVDVPVPVYERVRQQLQLKIAVPV